MSGKQKEIKSKQEKYLKKINPKQGKRLKDCLKQNQCKQTWLAAESHVSQQTISKIICGHEALSLDNARVFAEVLHVRAEYLLGEDDYMTEESYILSKLIKLKSISEGICSILDSKGYTILRDETIDKKQFKTITLSYPYEIVGKTDAELRENIIDKLKAAPNQSGLSLKGPDGRTIRITSKQFQDTLSDIENYIDYKMHVLYNDISNYISASDMHPKS